MPMAVSDLSLLLLVTKDRITLLSKVDKDNINFDVYANKTEIIPFRKQLDKLLGNDKDNDE